MASQQQSSNTKPSLRDSWQTPQWLFNWADARFNFDIDLAASFDNAKVDPYVSIENDSLSGAWNCEDFNCGWVNPPYSETGRWLKKGWEEARKGFRSVFLVPAPSGENGYKDYVFGKASEIIFINGRVAFELPNGDGTATPVNGNTRGSCLIIYNRRYEGHTQISWVNRDDMKAEYEVSR